MRQYVTKLFLILLTINLMNCSTTLKPHNLSSQFLLNNLAQQRWMMQGKILLYYQDLINRSNIPIIGKISLDNYPNHAIMQLQSTWNLVNLTVRIQHDQIPNQFTIIHSSNNNEVINQTINNLEPIINFQDLNYWIFGKPVTNKMYQPVKDGFIQNNWQINYAQVLPKSQNIQAFPLPKIIKLKYLGKTLKNNQINIKIMINNLEILN